MTFLELVQALWEESGSTGIAPGVSTVVSQTGENLRLVNWVNRAWRDIQSMHPDWGWKRTSASFTTVAGQAIYPLGTGAGTVGVTAATFSEWARYTGRTYLTATGTSSEAFLPYMEYEGWRNTYQFGATRTANSRPVQYAISPAKAVCLGPVALAGYTVTLDYFSAPTDLTLDDDEPDMPAEFHMAIVWRALMKYGAYEGAPDAYDHGKEEWKSWKARLEASRLPEVGFAGALA